MQTARPHPSLEAGLSRIDNRNALFLTLGAAGATLAVVVALLGTPALVACSGDARGLVTCVRDLIDQRFDLPGDIPGARAEIPAAPPISAAPLLTGERAGETAPPDQPAAAPVPVLPDEEAVAPTGLVAEAPSQPRSEAIPPAAVPEPAPAAPAPPAASLPPVAATKPDLPAAETTFAEAESDPAPPTVISDTAFETAAQPEPTPPSEPRADPTPGAIVAQPVPEPRPPSPEIADPVPPALVEDDPPPFELAEVSPLPPAPQAQVVAVPPQPPTIDAIEIDGADNFVAGAGPTGALMRLYVDDELVGESLVEGGRWLVEGVDILGRLTQTLRVEASDLETGHSLGNAAISLEFELPDTEDVPTEPESSFAAPPPPGKAVAADTPLTSTLPPAPPPVTASTRVVPDLPPEMPPPLPPATGAPQTPVPDLELPRAASPKSAVAAAPEPAPPAAQVVAPEPLPPPKLPPLRTIVPATESASVTIIGVPPPDASELSVIRAFPIGARADQRFVTGTAIIRRGDTLWSLARRAYGHGIHYRTILNANRDLIRRPSRIYPGQVLDLPVVTDD